MNILALDLGKFNTTCCVFDTKTRKSRFVTTPTQRESLSVILKQNKAELVVMESCGPSGWINDLAQSLGRSTLVCSTNEEAWRWANVRRKTGQDRASKAQTSRSGEANSSSRLKTTSQFIESKTSTRATASKKASTA